MGPASAPRLTNPCAVILRLIRNRRTGTTQLCARLINAEANSWTRRRNPPSPFVNNVVDGVDRKAELLSNRFDNLSRGACGANSVNRFLRMLGEVFGNWSFRNVFPPFPVDGLLNTAVRSTKLSSYRVQGHIGFLAKLAHLGNLLFGEARHRIAASTRPVWKYCSGVIRTLRLPVLLNHVARVVSIGSEEKMRWSATIRNIAVVTYKQAIRYFSKLVNVRKSVCADEAMRHTGYAVSRFVSTSCPQPARPKFWTRFWNWAALVNLPPENLGTHFWSSHRLRLSAESTP